MFSQPEFQSGNATNPYLQMMMNFLRQGKPTPINQFNMFGSPNMTGQPMGQPMGQTTGGGQGTFSQLHNVMQKPGTLARSIPQPGQAGVPFQSQQMKPKVNTAEQNWQNHITRMQQEADRRYQDQYGRIGQANHLPETWMNKQQFMDAAYPELGPKAQQFKQQWYGKVK